MISDSGKQIFLTFSKLKVRILENVINLKIRTVFRILLDTDQNYFFLFGLNAAALHLLHFTLPARIFIMVAFVTVLHFLQTNLFRNNRASASGNFAILRFNLFHYFLIKDVPEQNRATFSYFCFQFIWNFDIKCFICFCIHYIRSISAD